MKTRQFAGLLLLTLIVIITMCIGIGWKMTMATIGIVSIVSVAVILIFGWE